MVVNVLPAFHAGGCSPCYYFLSTLPPLISQEQKQFSGFPIFITICIQVLDCLEIFMWPGHAILGHMNNINDFVSRRWLNSPRTLRRRNLRGRPQQECAAATEDYSHKGFCRSARGLGKVPFSIRKIPPTLGLVGQYFTTFVSPLSVGRSEDSCRLLECTIVRPGGIEPPTLALKGRCSTN